MSGAGFDVEALQMAGAYADRSRTKG